MSLAAKAYENDWYFMMDIIDSIKGSGHCEKQWDKEFPKPKSNYEKANEEWKKQQLKRKRNFW